VKLDLSQKAGYWLPKYNDPRNLVGFGFLTHTRFTYHRTWETGLGAEIRVTVANLAFFCPCLSQQHSTTFPTSHDFLAAKFL